MMNILKNIFGTNDVSETNNANNKGENVMARTKLSKRDRVLNLLNKGQAVSWKTLRTRFDLESPRAMIDSLRRAGNMIYINKTAKGTSYRVGSPSKAIIAAGIEKLYGTKSAYEGAQYAF